jgi:hypothetical protein
VGRARFEAIRHKPAILAEGLRDRAILREIAINHFRAAFLRARSSNYMMRVTFGRKISMRYSLL